MTLVHECACDRAGSGIEIFVGTPDGEIDVPIVQGERDVADRMRKIEPRDDSVLVRCRGDLFDVEQLTGEKIHRADHHNRKLIGMLLDKIDNLFCSNRELAFTRPRQNERFLWIEAVMNAMKIHPTEIRDRLSILPLRGNVDTRLRKLDAGDYDCIVLASAGLHRMALQERLAGRLL